MRRLASRAIAASCASAGSSESRALLQLLDRHRRGHLAGLRAAHAVGHREQRRANGQRVLVRGPLAAHVGAAGLLDDAERHPAIPRSGIRCRRCGSCRPRQPLGDCTFRPFRYVPLVDPMSSRYMKPPRSKMRAWTTTRTGPPRGCRHCRRGRTSRRRPTSKVVPGSCPIAATTEPRAAAVAALGGRACAPPRARRRHRLGGRARPRSARGRAWSCARPTGGTGRGRRGTRTSAQPRAARPSASRARRSGPSRRS